MNSLSLINDLIAFQEPDQKSLQWFREKSDRIKNGQPKDFYIAFSSTHRFIKKNTVTADSLLSGKLTEIYPSFDISGWTLDQLIRLAFVLTLGSDNNKRTLENLFTTADVNEQVVLYKSLFFLENASEFTGRAAEGIRSNMTVIFDSIALNNPFPYKYLSEEAWNQMVLKAIFLQRPVYKIYGIDERSNKDLAFILNDYAHERWAAGRNVSPELWRMTSSFVNEKIFDDLASVVKSGTSMEVEAAAKALQESSYDRANVFLRNHNIQKVDKSWDEIGAAVEKNIALQ